MLQPDSSCRATTPGIRMTMACSWVCTLALHPFGRFFFFGFEVLPQNESSNTNFEDTSFYHSNPNMRGTALGVGFLQMPYQPRHVSAGTLRGADMHMLATSLTNICLRCRTHRRAGEELQFATAYRRQRDCVVHKPQVDFQVPTSHHNILQPLETRSVGPAPLITRRQQTSRVWAPHPVTTGPPVRH
jgi:hypothetical protein